MNQLWLISVPGDPTCEAAYAQLKETIIKSKLCSMYKFHVPPLNVGTLDKLFSALDEFGKLETDTVVPLIGRLVQSLAEIGGPPKLHSPLDMLTIQNQSLEEYVLSFTWDDAAYPVRQPVREMHELIQNQMNTMDAELSVKLRMYNQSVATYSAVVLKRKGNLATRYLGDFLTKDDFIVGSDFLKTVLVCVPTSLKNLWLCSYESLDREVVPRSNVLLGEDSEFALYSVAVLKRAEKRFTDTARARGFLPREFDCDPEEIHQFRRQLSQLYQDHLTPYMRLIEWMRDSFATCYVALVHIEAARLFVDSVLRYGFPRNFQPVLLIVEAKSVQKLRKVLHRLYCHLDASVSCSSAFESSNEGHYPYVCYEFTAAVHSFLK